MFAVIILVEVEVIDDAASVTEVNHEVAVSVVLTVYYRWHVNR